MSEDPQAPPDTIDDLLTGRFATADEINPPDIDPMGLLDRGTEPVDLGIAGQYAKTMYDLVGSSRNYHELGALCMVGAAIQHRYLPLTWAQREKLRPNIFGAILGRSTFDHKSTGLSKVHETMPWEQMPNCYSLPGMFTEEGLYKELADHPMGLIVRDEIGILFASRNRKYTEFVVPFLTDAFGGWMHAKRLSSASYAAREVSLSMIGATTYTEFARTTAEHDWDSGWLVRWLYAVPDSDYDPTADPRWPTDADRAGLERFKFHLADLNRRDANPMRADQAALEHIAAWRKTLIRAAMGETERHERVDAIIERYATYAYKFAMILCAARGDGERILLDHAQDACRLAENYMTNVFSLYQYQKEHRLTGALIQKALAVLNREKRGLTAREIGQLAHLSATMRDEVITRLLEMGAVSESKSGKTTRYTATIARIPPQRLG